MTDKNTQRLQEEREDAALRLLMEEYAEIEGEALWREFQAAQTARDQQTTQSREDREKGRGSRETHRRTDFLKRFGVCVRRAAVIFLVLVCLLSPLVMSVEAFKLPVLNYFMALEKKFSGYSFGANETLRSEQEALINLIISVPCPEGYLISKQEITPDGKIWIHFTYQGRKAMKISIFPSTGQINIDTEDVEQIPMKILDYETLYLQKDGRRLMWMDANRELIFNVHAFELEEEDFWVYVSELLERLSE